MRNGFDTSDYPTNHPSGIKTGLNSKVLGMFKDEAGGKQFVEFVGLRAKLYSYKILDGSEDKNVRGSQWMLQNGVFNSMSIESACLQEGTISKNERHTKSLSCDLYRKN